MKSLLEAERSLISQNIRATRHRRGEGFHPVVSHFCVLFRILANRLLSCLYISSTLKGSKSFTELPNRRSHCLQRESWARTTVFHSSGPVVAFTWPGDSVTDTLVVL